MRRLTVVALVLAAACGGHPTESDFDSPPGDDPPGEEPVDEGAAPVAGCTDGTVEQTGARYRICFPSGWNGDLVLYAHGYTPPDEPLMVRDDVLGGQPVSAHVADLGYAFAATSYRVNGLVGPEAVEDVVDLVATVRRLYRPDPVRVYLVGVSEGGLVAALTAEAQPDLLDGAVAACGPIGSFQRQVDHIGDFRVVFDYFFPGVLPGSAVEVPEEARANWSSTYVPAIVAALQDAPDRAVQLIRVTGAAVDLLAPSTIVETTVGLLFYSVFGTADAQRRLGGQPFDNRSRVYAGSANDAALNAGVERFTADPAARAAVAEEFETSGRLAIPVVTLHTSGDPIVPVSQQALYEQKAAAAGSDTLHVANTPERYGHCEFTPEEFRGAFATLVDRVVSGSARVAVRGRAALAR